MDDASQTHGAFSWCELMTTDVESAKTFYSALFGWETMEFPIPNMEYTVINAGGKSVGGIMPMPEKCQGMPPSWGCYVTVQDVDATAKKVAELGGNVLVPPTDIPNVGRFAVIQDPQGAWLSVITYFM